MRDLDPALIVDSTLGALIDRRADPEERHIPSLAGYRGMGPARAGNQAF